ncbi:hypothetical protein D3C77_250810 [compost metagenome]
MLTTKPKRKRRTLVKRKKSGLGVKRKPLLKRKRRLHGRKKGLQARRRRLRRRKQRDLPIPVEQSIPALPSAPEPIQAVPLQAPYVHDPAQYQQAYDEAYQEGFNSGFSKGFEDGHKLAYKNRV